MPSSNWPEDWMSDQPNVVVLGSANLDIVVPVPHHPATGETVLGGHHDRIPGGKGANQAVAAARLGARVAMVGRVGSDDAGGTLRTALQEAGVDCRYLAVDGLAPSGLALIGVDGGGDNTIIVSPGANDRIGPDDVAAAAPLLASAAVTLVQLEVPAMAVEAAVATSGGVDKGGRGGMSGLGPVRIEAYLRRVEYEGSGRPSGVQGLRRLHLAHMRRVPFENLDIHLGREIVLSEESLYRKVVEDRRGGFC